ncbi:MAG: type II secretion system major pseudopilin GspG [Burkholderiales bacterium]|jgi:general secretion pathway protein G
MNTSSPSHRVATHRPSLLVAHRAARGFTLLELLVVLVILGLLASLVGPRLFGNVSKSEVKVARAQIAALETAIENFRLDVGRYPSTEEGLAALQKAPADDPRWAGPYLKKTVPNDPWGQPYQYRFPGERGDFDIVSLGRDGRPGGSGDDGDLSNR